MPSYLSSRSCYLLKSFWQQLHHEVQLHDLVIRFHPLAPVSFRLLTFLVCNRAKMLDQIYIFYLGDQYDTPDGFCQFPVALRLFCGTSKEFPAWAHGRSWSNRVPKSTPQNGSRFTISQLCSSYLQQIRLMATWSFPDWKNAETASSVTVLNIPAPTRVRFPTCIDFPSFLIALKVSVSNTIHPLLLAVFSRSAFIHRFAARAVSTGSISVRTADLSSPNLRESVRWFGQRPEKGLVKHAVEPETHIIVARARFVFEIHDEHRSRHEYISSEIDCPGSDWFAIEPCTTTVL